MMREARDARGTALDPKPTRPKVARMASLCPLRSARRALRRIAVIGAPPALEGGRFTGSAALCCGTAFFDAERAEPSAEDAEPISLRPAVAVSWCRFARSSCPDQGG